MKVSVKDRVPFSVQEALVDASGKLFWYRDPYAAFISRAGVPEHYVNQLVTSGMSKYKVMRAVLAELDKRGAAGAQIQRQLIQEMVSMPIRDGEVDADAAAKAQATLRRVATAHGLLASEVRVRESDEVKRRREAAAKQRRSEAERRQRLTDLHADYLKLLVGNHDRQARGYRLEEVIGQVAKLEGLRYTPPFRKGTVTQTDGMITLDGFQYLVEARWRQEPADVQALGALSAKASRSIQSTRALFVSMVGYRGDVIAEMQTGTKNLVLMTGQELEMILDQRLTLAEALRAKVEHGAKKGEIFFDLATQP